jgi:MFS family permease
VLARRDAARRYWMGIVAALGGMPFYLAGLFAARPERAFILMGIGVLISSSYNGVAAALIQYFVRSRHRALAGGLYLFVISIAGFGLGPPLAGFLMDRVFTGPDSVPMAISSIIIACGIGATVSFIQAMRHYHTDAVTGPDDPEAV